jgi:hypothetical protein
MKKPIVTIIVLNFNGYQDTNKCLKSIKNTKYRNYEIILVDNGSDTKEAQKLKKDSSNLFKGGKRVKFLRLKKNLGFTGGNNLALKKARGKYIVLLNNDTVVDKGWLSPLVEYMQKHKNVAVVQPKILQLNDNDRFDYAGAAGGFIDKYGYPFTRGRIFNTQEKDLGQYDKISKIFWASGAACMIRRSAIKKVGGLFSENLFNYMEEIDFCWRAWNAGFKVMYHPDSIVYHKGASTAKRNLYKKRFWEHRNNLFILARNLDLNEFITILPLRALMEFATYLKYIAKGEWTYLRSLFFAHLDFFTKLFIVRLKRNRLPNYKRKPVYPGSIVYDYFLRNKSKLSQLDWSPIGNITFIIFHNVPSGGLKLIFEFANAINKRGYYVKIYSIFNHSTPEWFNLNVTFSNIIKYFIDKKPDVLITTFWPTHLLSPIMNAREKYYFILGWEVDFYDNKILKSLVKTTYKLPGNIIAISPAIKKRVSKYVNNKKIHVSKTPFIDTRYFNTKGTSKHWVDTKDKKIKVLSVISRYNPQKGPDLLEMIVREIKKRYDNYEFHLVSFEDYPYSKVFDKFHTKLSPKEMSEMYKHFNVTLMTSRFEGLLGVGLEAMACGCPVVTKNTPGVTDYANHMYNAIVVDNIEKLWKENIIYKLLSNIKLVEKLTKNGLQTAKLYTVKSATDNLESIIS